MAVLQNISCPRPGLFLPEQPASRTGRHNHVPDGALRKKSRHGRGGILADGQQKNFRSGAAAGRRNGRTGDGDMLQESGAKNRGMAGFWPELRQPEWDRMCNCITAHTRPHNYPGQGVARHPGVRYILSPGRVIVDVDNAGVSHPERHPVTAS